MDKQIVKSVLPFMAVIIPVIGAFITGFVKGKKGLLFTMAVTILTFLIVCLMTGDILMGKVLVTNTPTGMRIGFAFFSDSLSYIVGLICAAVWMLSTVYAVDYMARENNQRRYDIASLFSLAGVMGVIFTKNLFTLYIFFELLCVASYIMVIHRETEEARKAGSLYIMMLVCGGLIMLCSAIATYALAGTGDLMKLASQSKEIYYHGVGVTGALKFGSPLVPLIFFGFCFGFGAKAGIFPVHVWLPPSYPPAPSPCCSLLSGVMIKAGAYGIIRAFYVIMGAGFVKIEPHKMSMLILVFACVNIFLGSAMAIREQNLKKMLAYSSISQVGYILLGMALMTPYGLTGSILHIFNHAVMKSCLFLCAGAYITQTGFTHLDQLKGIGKRMPLTTICFSISSLSMIGFPPFAGFISKWFLGLGSLEIFQITGPHPYGRVVGIICVLTLMLSGYMNLVYFGPIVYNAWFPNTDDPEWQVLLESQAANRKLLGERGAVSLPEKTTEDPGWWMMAPILILGFGSLFFGVFPAFPVKLATMASKMLLLH